MSFNRTTYDNCSYKQELQGNVSTLSYLLSPYRYEHENKCRHQFQLKTVLLKMIKHHL